MVYEEAREVGVQADLSETEMEVLNRKLSLIADVLENGPHPVLKFTYFIDDIAKTGGSYVCITERVRKVDNVSRKIQLYKTVGLSKNYMELDMDKIKDIVYADPRTAPARGANRALPDIEPYLAGAKPHLNQEPVRIHQQAPFR